MKEVIKTSLLWEFDQKKHFFEGYCWFKFNNFGLALGKALKFYTGATKGLKVRDFGGLNPMFVEFTEKKHL